VLSPTYVLMREYVGGVRLFHVDLYRADAASFEEIGALDLAGHTGMVVVEWGEKITAMIDSAGQDHLDLIVEKVDDHTRLLSFSTTGEGASRHLEDAKGLFPASARTP